MSTEYNIYVRLCAWGYDHKRVNHGGGDYDRDEDGDGFYEVHVHTMEGFWPLWRSWLHPHWGISQEKLPLYLGFFEFVHGFDHGVGHPLLLLRDAKAPPCQKNKAFKDLGHYPEWPKVADAVIEALFTMPESEAKPCLVHSLR